MTYQDIEKTQINHHKYKQIIIKNKNYQKESHLHPLIYIKQIIYQIHKYQMTNHHQINICKNSIIIKIYQKNNKLKTNNQIHIIIQINLITHHIPIKTKLYNIIFFINKYKKKL